MPRSDGRPVTRRIDAPADDHDRTRTYIEITPAEASPNPDDVRRGFKRLHRQLQADDDGSRLGGLFSHSQPTALEWLLVSDGGESRPIRYLVGCTEAGAATLDGLESTLRTVFPSTYEFDRVDCHPGALLSPTDAGRATPGETGGSTRQRQPYVAGVEFTDDNDHPLDWQTRLTPYAGTTPATDTTDERPGYRRGPVARSQSSEVDAPSETTLSGLLETMAAAQFPIVYQVLLEPKPDWTTALEDRRGAIEDREDYLADIVIELFFGDGTDDENDDERPLSDIAERRLEALAAKNPRTSFEVTIRAAVVGSPDGWDDPQPVDATARELATALASLGTSPYEVVGRVRYDDTVHAGTIPPGRQVLEAIVDRERAASPPSKRTDPLFARDDRYALVADCLEAPTVCVLDGAALPAAAHRAVGPRHSERTAIVPPPPATLDHFRGEGFYLGHVKDQDGAPERERLVLPPEAQTTHSLIMGKSGSGKSVLGQTGGTSNHGATDGASIVIERKGGGFTDEYLRTHYAMYGDLDDVICFDVSEVVPAFSILDIRPDLEAGRTRRAAVEDRANYFAEILAMLMTGDQYEEAKVSPHVIKFLIKAALDPVHGDDAITFQAFQALLGRLHHQGEAPPTVYDGVTRGLHDIAANATTSYEDVMAGATNRVQDIQQHMQLFEMFNHAPADRDDGDTPLFSFDELLDEDVTIVFDISGLRSEGQRAFTGVVFAQLWAALKRRATRDGQAVEPSKLDFGNAVPASESDAESDDGAPTPEPTTDGGVDHADHASDASGGGRPLVNLYLEEAADVAATDMVGEFLQQARGFDCGVTLSMQFPEQVKHTDPSAYDELLNDVSTIVAGNVGDDRRLARRFQTDAMSAEAVANRLRALPKGEWLVSLPAPWGAEQTRPFLMESAPLQPGHPDGPDPLTGPHETLYKAALDRCKHRTADQYGIEIRAQAPETPADREDAPESTPTDDSMATEASETPQLRQSALPHTTRLPDVVDYDDAAHALVCAGCDKRYAATANGMKKAITCCNSRDVVDRDDVPICDVPLTLSPAECAATDYSVPQLCFLQAVVMAHQGRFDADLEYDIQRDSMLRLREYLDIDEDAVTELREDGLLNQDGDHPHRLYTVTTAGLERIGEQQREGITHGDGIGDLGESSTHRVMVLDGADLLRQACVDDPDHPATTVRTYHQADGYRYDAVALDADGEIVAALEAERTNHDLSVAAPEDYDKLAAAEPREAIWIAENRDGAHRVLEALNEPKDNVQRVEKTYSESTAPQRFNIDEPGLTDIHTIGYVRNTLLSE